MITIDDESLTDDDRAFLGDLDEGPRSELCLRSRWPSRKAAMDRRRVSDEDDIGHSGRCLLRTEGNEDDWLRCSLDGVLLKQPVMDRVRSVLNAVLVANSKPQTSRAITVQGSPDIGKSIAVERAIMLRTQHVRATAEPYIESDGTPHEVIPWIYVEASASAGTRGVVAEICRFAGLPALGGENADTLLDRLRTNLPKMRCEGIALDDGHMFAATRDGTMTNQLKHMITSLGVTVLIAGNDLRESAVLSLKAGNGYEAARQIRRRAVNIDADPFAIPSVDHPRWAAVLQHLASQVHMPDGTEAAEYFLDKSNCAEMYEATDGAIGTATKFIEMAASLAVTQRRMPFGQAISDALTMAA